MGRLQVGVAGDVHDLQREPQRGLLLLEHALGHVAQVTVRRAVQRDLDAHSEA